ncbi:MAG: FKBP-type peptidyl-prolyl cis-trans isomerase N-terminal domain-containing protein [Bacteroidetes bacterium]|nr:FKBP-type peptidyl-prolyl cis-trans isomerase N-terminal domain-containing protein [Bacteroidota bacterium]
MIKQFSALALICSVSACAFAQNNKEVVLKNQSDSISYAIGSSIGGSLKKDGLDASLNLDILKAAMEAAFKGQSLLIDGNQAQQVLNAYFAEQQAKKEKRL